MEAGCTREAVDMYNTAGMWEQAHKVGGVTVSLLQGFSPLHTFFWGRFSNQDPLKDMDNLR